MPHHTAILVKPVTGQQQQQTFAKQMASVPSAAGVEVAQSQFLNIKEPFLESVMLSLGITCRRETINYSNVGAHEQASQSSSAVGFGTL